MAAPAASLRAVADAALQKQVRTVHVSLLQTYGASRAHADLRTRNERREEAAERTRQQGCRQP